MPTMKPNQKQRPPKEPRIPKIFSLVIHCRDENHQRQIYEQLAAQKIDCRVITL
jgi:hypothetical protein